MKRALLLPKWPSRALSLAAAGLLLWVATVSHAHGDWKPKHGGVLNDGETTFEFVLRPDGMTIYISDHDEPLPTDGAVGRLEVTRADDVVTYDLEPAGANSLKAKTHTAWARGDKLLSRVVMGDGSIRVGRVQLQ